MHLKRQALYPKILNFMKENLKKTEILSKNKLSHNS